MRNVFSKVIPVLVLVALSSVSMAAGEFTATDITSSAATALTASLPMIAAAGLGALTLWGAKIPVRIGLGFLRTLFK